MYLFYLYVCKCSCLPVYISIPGALGSQRGCQIPRTGVTVETPECWGLNHGPQETGVIPANRVR